MNLCIYILDYCSEFATVPKIPKTIHYEQMCLNIKHLCMYVAGDNDFCLSSTHFYKTHLH